MHNASSVSETQSAAVEKISAAKEAQAKAEELFMRLETIGIDLNKHYKIPTDEVIEQNKKIDKSLYRWFIYNFQDEDDPINQLQKTVVSLGGKVTDESNMYEDKNHSYFRATYAQDEFEDNEIANVIGAYREIIRSNRLELVRPNWVKSPSPTLPTREGVPLSNLEKISVYLQAKDIVEAEELKLPDRGRQGFIADLDIFPENYIEMVEKSVKKEDIANLQQSVKAATKFSLDILYNHGLIDEGTYEKFASRNHYVPERGWQERDMFGRKTHFIDGGGVLNHNPYNAAMAKAKGRSTLASDPIAYIQSIGHSSILSAEKNRTKIAALNFVLQNEEIGRDRGLFGFNRVWYVENGDYHEDGSPLYNEVYQKPSQELFDAYKVKNEVNSRYKVMLTKEESKQREVIVYANGQRYQLWFSNELIANGLNRNTEKSDMERRIKYARQVTKFMSGLMTQYNPSFALWNFARDTGTALINNYCTYGMGFSGSVLKNVFGNGQLHAALGRYILGTKGTKETIYDKRLRDFLEDGAATGFSFLKDIKQLQIDIEKEINRSKAGGYANKFFNFFPKTFSALTEYSELLTRFAQYNTLLDKGFSRFQATTGAKDVSVNFNKKGAMRFLSSFFTFYNATIQGTALIGKTFYAHKGKFAGVVSTLFIGGFLNAFFTPDDPDEERAWGEYDRMQNLLIGSFKVPLPQGFRVFWAAGVQAALAARNAKSVGEAITDAAKYTVAELLPIDLAGGVKYDPTAATFPHTYYDWKSGFLELAPTGLRPVGEVLANQTFTGSKIHPEGFTEAQKKSIPQTFLGHKTVNPAMQNLTDFLFEIGGGDKAMKTLYTPTGEHISKLFDWNPSNIEHLTVGYSGGVGKFVLDGYNTIYNGIKGNFDPSVVPFLNRAYKPYNEDIILNRKRFEVIGKLNAYKNYESELEKAIEKAQKDKNKSEIARLRTKLAEFQKNKQEKYQKMEKILENYNNDAKKNKLNKKEYIKGFDEVMK